MPDSFYVYGRAMGGQKHSSGVYRYQHPLFESVVMLEGNSFQRSKKSPDCNTVVETLTSPPIAAFPAGAV
jgi:hypothetical protein